MQINILRLLIGSILVFIFSSHIASASIAAPQYGVNDATMQCAQFAMGDECTSCALPDGWRAIDISVCPSAYTPVDMKAECTPNPDPYCYALTAETGNDIEANIDAEKQRVQERDAVEEESSGGYTSIFILLGMMAIAGLMWLLVSRKV